MDRPPRRPTSRSCRCRSASGWRSTAPSGPFDAGRHPSGQHEHGRRQAGSHHGPGDLLVRQPVLWPVLQRPDGLGLQPLAAVQRHAVATSGISLLAIILANQLDLLNRLLLTVRCPRAVGRLRGGRLGDPVGDGGRASSSSGAGLARLPRRVPVGGGRAGGCLGRIGEVDDERRRVVEDAQVVDGLRASRSRSAATAWRRVGAWHTRGRCACRRSSCGSARRGSPTT